MLIQKSKVLFNIEYKIWSSSYIQAVYILCTNYLLTTKREVSCIFDGQNAHTKIPPEISKLDLLYAHNIHFTNLFKQ
jgi:hypothetical protein